MPIRQFISLIAIISVAVVGCRNNEDKLSKEEIRTKIDSLRIQNMTQNMFDSGMDSVKIDSLNQHKTTLKFEKELFDFGEIKEGTILERKIVYTNTGQNPLVIFSASGSCGCTVPTYSKEPLASGASDTLFVSFNSTGRSGNQSKAVKVFANTEPSFSEFKFTVKVK